MYHKLCNPDQCIGNIPKYLLLQSLTDLQVLVSETADVIVHPTAGMDFVPLSATVTFTAGSSSGPPPAIQCTPVNIANDLIVEERFELFTLTASSSAPNVEFTSGGNVASVQIEDDDSKFSTYDVYYTSLHYTPGREKIVSHS